MGKAVRNAYERVEEWKSQLANPLAYESANPVGAVELSEEEAWELSGGDSTNTCVCCQDTCGKCCGAPSSCTCSCFG